jgi:hypothetical protein
MNLHGKMICPQGTGEMGKECGTKPEVKKEEPKHDPKAHEG